VLVIVSVVDESEDDSDVPKVALPELLGSR
jgi:hypothetical protein